MIMGHSESKYQRLEPKKEKFKKNSSDPLSNVHKQKVQRVVVHGVGTTPPNEKISTPSSLRRTVLEDYPTPNETRASMGYIICNHEDDVYYSCTRLSPESNVGLVSLHLKCNEKSCHRYFFPMWLCILMRIWYMSSNQNTAPSLL